MADRDSTLIEQSNLPDANPVQGKENLHSNSQLDPSQLNDKSTEIENLDDVQMEIVPEIVESEKQLEFAPVIAELENKQSQSQGKLITNYEMYIISNLLLLE